MAEEVAPALRQALQRASHQAGISPVDGCMDCMAAKTRKIAGPAGSAATDRIDEPVCQGAQDCYATRSITRSRLLLDGFCNTRINRIEISRGCVAFKLIWTWPAAAGMLSGSESSRQAPRIWQWGEPC